MVARRIAFISTMDTNPWGGSEELWGAAAGRLVADGHSVMASVRAWTPLHSRVRDLVAKGVELHQRPARAPIWLHGYRMLTGAARSRGMWLSDILPALAAFRPDLVLISEGGTLPPIELAEHLADRYPFSVVLHGVQEHWWPDDDLAARQREVLSKARAVFVVAESSRRLLDKMLAMPLANVRIARNPFNVAPDACPPWPALGANDELRLAMVGRLDAKQKGQDLLFEVLAQPDWQSRSWRLEVCGGGEGAAGLKTYAARLGLGERVHFSGQVASIEAVWSRNHLLVQPSRWECMPLSVVEAMLCARPVVATSVGGIEEIIDDDVSGFLAEAPTQRHLAAALERAWLRRSELEAIGAVGAARIRQQMPRDPASRFADDLIRLSLSSQVEEAAPQVGIQMASG